MSKIKNIFKKLSKKISIRSLYFAYIIIALLTFYFSGSVVTEHSINNKSEPAQKYKESINELRAENLKREASKLGMPVVEGVQKYTKLVLQNGTKIQNMKTNKAITLKNLPAQGLIKKAFFYNNNYYFYDNKIAHKILKNKEEN